MDTNSLAQIVANPAYPDRLSDDDLVDALADLEGLRVRIWLRLLELSGGNEEGREDSAEPEQDQMLRVDEAAEILGVTPRWVYDHSDDLPFTRRLAPDAPVLGAGAVSVIGEAEALVSLDPIESGTGE